MTGRHLVPLALEQGFKVKALVRTPSKVSIQHDNLTLIEGDFASIDAIKEAITSADYVICCAGAPARLKEYPKDMMLNFVSSLVPLLENEASVKVLLYQAGAFSKTPDGQLPFAIKVMRPILGPIMGLVPHVLDNDSVIRYLAQNKPSSFHVIVTRPGQLQDKEKGREVVASDSPETSAITFKSLAAFTLLAIKDETLFGKHPYCALAKS